MRKATKLFFTVGPYDGFISYTTRKEAQASLLPGEFIVGLELNKNQQKVINQARQEAFAALG